MLGSSRRSLAATKESMDSLAVVSLPAVSADLYAMASLLESDRGLRAVLSDEGIVTQARRGVVRDLLSSLDPVSSAFAQDVVAQRWSHEADLVDAFEILAAQAALQDANERGSLDRVEDDLFRFGRVLDTSPELQLTLTDPAISGERKAALVRDLLADRAEPTSATVLAYAAGHLRGRSPQQVVGELAELAASQRDRVLAQVSAAVPLDAQQQQRLASALERLVGRKVRLQVETDAGLVGGMVVRVGDQVYDGSVATRLEQARRVLAG